MAKTLPLSCVYTFVRGVRHCLSSRPSGNKTETKMAKAAAKEEKVAAYNIAQVCPLKPKMINNVTIRAVCSRAKTDPTLP